MFSSACGKSMAAAVRVLPRQRAPPARTRARCVRIVVVICFRATRDGKVSFFLLAAASSYGVRLPRVRVCSQAFVKFCTATN